MARREIGRAKKLEELIALLAKRRRDLGLAQIDLDDLAGFQDGYTGKLEVGGVPRGGRNPGTWSLPRWLRALGVELAVIEVDPNPVPETAIRRHRRRWLGGTDPKRRSLSEGASRSKCRTNA